MEAVSHQQRLHEQQRQQKQLPRRAERHDGAMKRTKRAPVENNSEREDEEAQPQRPKRSAAARMKRAANAEEKDDGLVESLQQRLKALTLMSAMLHVERLALWAISAPWAPLTIFEQPRYISMNDGDKAPA
jgi:hypothetical protein